MKRTFKVLILLVFMFILSGCDIKLTKKSYMKEISYKKYHELLDNNETFILEIMRTDCSACIKFKPIITEVANENKIQVKYINTDSLTEDEVNSLYDETGISGTPTVIFYIKGKEDSISTRLVGTKTKEQVVNRFKVMGFLKEE